MISLMTYTTPLGPCGYLPDQTWRLQYDIVSDMSPLEYQQRLERGWRHFGHALFRPQCPTCRACQSLRVPAARFQPNRSQRRAGKANEGKFRLEIGTPAVSLTKLALHDKFHRYQSFKKGWALHEPKDTDSYAGSFVHNPFSVREWCYYLEDRLVGVGYVDELPESLSAIYFFYDPAERQRSLGTWNVLKIIEYARAHGQAHIYLGYYVKGCRSLEYKANFRPNEMLGPDGHWHVFRE
jgi:arginine-tRNA-protein transferase